MLLDTACERGMSASNCLRGTGLDAESLADPTEEILASQEERLIENIVDELGDDPAIGLQAGASYRLPTFGMFGLAIMSAQTPREMIEVSLRCQDLSATLARARLVNAERHGFLVLETTHLAERIRAFVIDHCLASIWVPVTEMDGVPHGAVVELIRARPASTAPYRELLGFEPRFRRPVDRIGFPHAYLDRRRQQVDPLALRQCEEQCRVLIEQRRARVGTAGLVRDRLVRAHRTWPSMKHVAADLMMSTRTLGRRLTQEGTTFREIEAEARMERAEQLLRQRAQTIEEIADLIGYATCSAFVRAFKRRHDTPPGAWRDAIHA